MPNDNLKNMIASAVEKKATEFNKSFNDEINTRILAAITQERESIASNLGTPKETTEDE